MSGLAEVSVLFEKQGDMRIPPRVEIAIDIEHPVGRRVTVNLSAEEFTRALSGSVLTGVPVTFGRSG